MLKQRITVFVQAMVAGPGGLKLKPGKVHELEDSPYVRILVKSGTVSLVDPPSLDLEFLEKAGYELRDGYTYPVQAVEKEPVNSVAPKAEIKVPEGFLTRTPKKAGKISKELATQNNNKNEGV